MSGDINPTEIKMNREERCLSISFDNGKTAVLSYEFLRVYSPSAEVRGHSPSQAVLQTGKANVMLTDIKTVGHYAVQLSFDDGHDSGLYTWEYLRTRFLRNATHFGKTISPNWRKQASR